MAPLSILTMQRLVPFYNNAYNTEWSKWRQNYKMRVFAITTKKCLFTGNQEFISNKEMSGNPTLNIYFSFIP